MRELFSARPGRLELPSRSYTLGAVGVGVRGTPWRGTARSFVAYFMRLHFRKGR